MAALDYLAWAVIGFSYFFVFMPCLFAHPTISYWDIVKGSIFLHICIGAVAVLVLSVFWAVERLAA